MARKGVKREAVDRATGSRLANATRLSVFTGTAGGLPMRHVGLPQLAVFVRPLF